MCGLDNMIFVISSLKKMLTDGSEGITIYHQEDFL